MAEKKVTQGQKIEADTSAVAQKKKWSTKKKVLVVVGAILGLFIVIITIVNQSTKEAVSVSNQMVNALQSTDATLAYGLLSSEAKKTVSEQEFSAVVVKIGPILNTQEKMVSKEVNAETGKSSTAKVTYEIQGTDGITYKLEINLVKEDDNWKVLNFDSSK